MSTGPDRIKLRGVVPADAAGARLDLAVSALFADYSRARLQKWIRGGELRVDGKTGKPTQKVVGGELIELDAEPELQEGVLAQDLPIDLIYQDREVLVVNKPPALVVHPAAGHHDGTLQNALLHFDPGLAAIPRCGIVHRLDKDTSGVMVVARTLRSHASLVAQLQSRTMSRVYEALVWGSMARAGSVNEPIGRHPRDRKRMAVVEGGREAVTHFRILESFGGISHLEVSLQTGRTHQIRVHMNHLGYPLVGDPQYGRKTRSVKGIRPGLLESLNKFPRQALHARRLRFVHPEDQQNKEFEAPLPADFQQLLSMLREHS